MDQSWEAFKAVFLAAIDRELTGKVIGWTFALSKDGQELITEARGYKRAPWELIAPNAQATPDMRIQSCSVGKAITSSGVMAVMVDWNQIYNLLLDTPGMSEERIHEIYMQLAAFKAYRPRSFIVTFFGFTIDLSPPPPPFPLPPQYRILVDTKLEFALNVFRYGREISLETPLLDLLESRLRISEPNSESFNPGNRIDELTLRSLLAHKSGLNPNVFGPSRSEEALWWGIKNTLQKDVDPSTFGIYTYNGANHMILRGWIETCTSEFYESFMQRRIFLPIGCMSMSNRAHEEVPTLYYSDPYADTPGQTAQPQPGFESDDLPWHSGNAGWVGTARDHVRWLDAIQSNELFPAQYGQYMRDGLGLYPNSDLLPELSYMHNGGGPGTSSEVGILASGYNACLMINSDGASAGAAIMTAMRAVRPVIDVTPPAGFLVPTVRIRNPLGYGDVLYTTDGTNPDPARPSSTRYATPIVVTRDTTVRSSVWEERHLLSGPVETVVPYAVAGFLAPVLGAIGGGLRWRYYEGDFNVIQDLATQTPVLEGITGINQPMDLSLLAPRQRDSNFGFMFDGYVFVTADDVYVFSLTSDDASRLWVGGTLVADNDGPHGDVTILGGIALGRGKHPMTLGYIQRGAGFSLAVSWGRPGMAADTPSLYHIP